MPQTTLRSVAALALWFFLGASASPAAERPPNQILILVDDMARDWVGAYGAAKATPNFNRLAAEGTRFETVWATPVCTPTRVAMLTGQYPFRTGWNFHYDVPRWGGRGLDPARFRTMGALLRAAGYATAIAGKWQINDLRPDPGIMRGHGFDEHCLWTGVEAGNPASEKRYWDAFLQRNGERRTFAGEFGPDIVQAFALDFIRRHRDQPFFLYYPMIPVHAPNEPTPLNRANPPAGEDALYAGMVTYADHQVGELLRVLDELGLKENTVIYFTGDNGSSTGGTLGGRPMPVAKAQVSDLGVHVPLLVRAPGLARPAAVSPVLADFTDLLPTMLELAGRPAPREMILDGRSLVPALRGDSPTGADRRWIYTQYGTHRAIRDQRYYYDSKGGFFDLVADPLQQANLAVDPNPALGEVRSRLAGILAAFPPDAAAPFPEYVHAERLLEENRRANRARQQQLREK
jgi:arylsulfatase A-like enzyme